MVHLLYNAPQGAAYATAYGMQRASKTLHEPGSIPGWRATLGAKDGVTSSNPMKKHFV